MRRMRVSAWLIAGCDSPTLAARVTDRLFQQREEWRQEVEVDGCQPVEVGRPGLPLLHHGPHSSPQTVAASQSRRSRGTGIR